MAITEKQLLSDLKANQFKPIYLLTGEENYYIDLIADYFENNIVAEECRDFDLSVVYGKDVDVRTIVSLAQQCPMLFLAGVGNEIHAQRSCCGYSSS